jgi:LPXTG-motif cell wall-anchored protein
MAALRLPLTGEEDMDMSTLLIILLVLFVLGGGGWGYSRWRA